MNLYLVQIKFEDYFMIAYININTRSQRHSHKTECSIESQFNTIKLPEKQTIAKILYFHSLDIFSTWNEGQDDSSYVSPPFTDRRYVNYGTRIMNMENRIV